MSTTQSLRACTTPACEPWRPRRSRASTKPVWASLVTRPTGPSHPKVLGIDCAPVELPTTVMIGHAADRAQADQSGRFVYSDFRVVALDGIDNIPAQASHEMATEIVLRTSSW